MSATISRSTVYKGIAIMAIVGVLGLLSGFGAVWLKRNGMPERQVETFMFIPVSFVAFSLPGLIWRKNRTVREQIVPSLLLGLVCSGAGALVVWFMFGHD